MSNKSNQVLKQAGILAMAGFLCRIIGFLYRMPLTYIIGNLGNGYFGYANNVYVVILLITSYSIPGALSKVMAERLAIKQYRNAQRVFYCSLIYVVIIGSLASLITFFVVPYIVSKETALVLKVFCPTIVLSGILGVFRGYFQSHGSMIQSSVSQIFEQIVNAIVSLIMAAVLVHYARVSSKTNIAVYGAIGSAIGTGIGVLTALIFMVLIYKYNRYFIENRLQKDKTIYEESYSRIFKVIIAMVTPIVLSTFIYNFNTTLNGFIFDRVSISLDLFGVEKATELYGIFSAKTVVLVNVPIAIASAAASALLPNIAGTYLLGGKKEASIQVNETLKILMIIVIPITVGMFVFAGPIMKFMYPGKGDWELAANLLKILCFDVVFISISTLSNAVLQAIGNPKITLINASIALIVQTIILVSLLAFTDAGVYALAIAAVLNAIIMCILNRRAVLKYLSYKQNVRTTYIYPILASVLMGGISFGIYYLLYKIYPNNRMNLIIAVIIAMSVYFIVLVKLGGVSEDEIRKLPKGNLLATIASKMKLFE